MEGVLDLLVDELDEYLHEVLQTTGHAGGGAARDDPEQNHDHQTQQQREE